MWKLSRMRTREGVTVIGHVDCDPNKHVFPCIKRVCGSGQDQEEESEEPERNGNPDGALGLIGHSKLQSTRGSSWGAEEFTFSQLRTLDHTCTGSCICTKNDLGQVAGNPACTVPKVRLPKSGLTGSSCVRRIPVD